MLGCKIKFNEDIKALGEVEEFGQGIPWHTAKVIWATVAIGGTRMCMRLDVWRRLCSDMGTDRAMEVFENKQERVFEVQTRDIAESGINMDQ